MLIASARRIPVLVSATACAALLLAACSSSGGSSANSSRASGGGSSSAAAPSSTAASSSAAAAPTSAQLQAITLQASEVPAGFTGTAYQADPSDAADQAALVACVGGKDTSADKTGEAHSDDYNMGNATISSQAESFKSQDDVNSDVEMLKSPKISGCYDSLFKSKVGTGLPSGTTIDSVSVVITPGTGGGPSNVAATATGKIDITAQGQAATIYLSVAFITGPLIESEVDVINLGASPAPSVVAPLVALVAGRTAAA